MALLKRAVTAVENLGKSTASCAMSCLWEHRMFDVKIIWPPLIGCIFTPPDSNSRGGLFPSPAFSAQLFNLNCMLLRLGCILVIQVPFFNVFCLVTCLYVTPTQPYKFLDIQQELVINPFLIWGMIRPVTPHPSYNLPHAHLPGLAETCPPSGEKNISSLDLCFL